MLLRREGWDVNGKRIYRLYREMGLQTRRKPPRRRVKAKLREGRCAATGPNETWSMDFVHDQLATGPKLRILTIVDTFSRYAPAVVPRFRFRAADVVEVLERVCAQVGYPGSIRVDQGSKFISRELDLWAYMKGVTLDFLNAHWFMSLTDAVTKCEAWRRDYNEERPHSAIGDEPPITLQKRSGANGQPLLTGAG